MIAGKTVRVALVGWGAIGRTAAAHLAETGVEIVGVARRTDERPDDLPPTAALVVDPAELEALRPDVVAEAAGRDTVGPWGHAALDLGADFVVSSVSALADRDLLDSLRAAATRSQILVQPGALAGVEALSAARAMGLDSVEHRIVKPPRAWFGTPAEALCDLGALTEAPEVFFRADAATTASEFPKNANVAMTTALAGVGPDATTIELVADPTTTTNRHEIAATGGFGRLDVAIANNPLPANPKTSAMAALSLVRTIANRATPIVI